MEKRRSNNTTREDRAKIEIKSHCFPHYLYRGTRRPVTLLPRQAETLGPTEISWQESYITQRDVG